MKKNQQNKIEILLIEYKSNTIKKRNFLVILLLLTPFIGYLLDVNDFNLGAKIAWCVLAILFILNVLYPFITKRYKKIGVISFSPNNILINEKKTNISEIDEIKFYYYGSKGDLHPGAALGVGIFGVQDGADNQIIIKTNENQESLYSILLESESSFILLKRRLLEYKEEGVKIKMERIHPSKRH